MLKLKNVMPPALGMALALGSTLALAAVDQHAGDVQPWVQGGKVQVNANVFEADFGDLAGGPFRTDDPGYDADTAKGAFGAGNWLWYQAVGTLKYWNGTSWSQATPNGEHIVIDDALGNSTEIRGSGVTTPLGVIGQFDAGGDVHEHLDFALRNSSAALGGSVGAYWIMLQLIETAPNSTTPLSTPSDPFHIVFNRGLSTPAFEAAVAAVPVPAAVWLFGSALAGLARFGRRSRRLA